MAGEIFAAFRTILLFISISWLSVMYLLVYRFPRVGRSQEDEASLDQLARIFEKNQVNARRKLQYANPNLSNANDAEQIFDYQDYNGGNDKQNSNYINFNCADMDKVELKGVLGQGYTKTVRKGVLNGQEFALKYTTEDNHDIVECKKQREKSRHFECFNLAKFKLLKEALLFQQLKHQSIVKLYGVCPWKPSEVEGSESVVTVVTELGTPLNMMKIIQTPWDERFQMAVDLVDLMLFFDTSPLGSLRVRDFRIDQFITVDGRIKLTDLDDVDAKRRPCNSAADCTVGGRSHNTTLPCQSGHCVRYSSTSNLHELDKKFLNHFFNYDNPDLVRRDLKTLSQKLENFSIGFVELQTDLRAIVRNIKTGVYSRKFVEDAKNQSLNLEYELFEDAAIVGGDYLCRESRSTSSCQLAVYNLREAKIICSRDRDCKGFVLTPNTNWLGQHIITLKNNGQTLTPVTKYSSFVRSL